MKKNIPVFVAVSAAAFMAGFFVLTVRPASAYAVGATSTGNSYDFGGSFQNLISPFTGFFNSLKLNDNTSIVTNGAPGYTPPTNLDMGPSLTNTLTGWLGGLNDWIYARTGFRPSDIIYVALNVLSWTLHLAEGAVNWLLGLFH